MRLLKKFLTQIVLATMIGYTLFQACLWKLCDGFSIHHIESPRPFSDQPIAFPYPTDILNQDFFYLNKGSQCYVFESADGEYVLKFFRHNRYRSSPFTQKLILPFFLAKIQAQRLAKKTDKLNRLFVSCKIAYQQLNEASGLIFAQLEKQPDTSFEIVVHDKIKRPYPIDLANHEFLIQKKGELLYLHLSRLIKAKEWGAAQKALKRLADLIVFRAEKGIADSDATIHKNLGFYQNSPIFLDIGEFSYSSGIEPKKELIRTTERLRKWLAVHDPQLHAYFIDLINAYQAPA